MVLLGGGGLAAVETETVGSYGEGVLWALSLMTTVGFIGGVPHTIAGKLIAATLMLFGFGLLAKLKKGSRAQILRRKINDEIWLPAEAHFVGNARLLLVKGLHIDALSEYSDYKKFSVATEATAVPEPPQ
jgi:hypothetical protein